MVKKLEYTEDDNTITLASWECKNKIPKTCVKSGDNYLACAINTTDGEYSVLKSTDFSTWSEIGDLTQNYNTVINNPNNHGKIIVVGNYLVYFALVDTHLDELSPTHALFYGISEYYVVEFNFN